MSYIPDARNKYRSSPYMKEERSEPNPYWHGLNNKYGKNELFGFDEAVEAINNLFDNLDVYREELKEIFGNEFPDEEMVFGFPPYSLGTNGNNELNPDYRDSDFFNSDEFEKMNHATRVVLTLKKVLNDWLEMRRDEINTSLIENMDEDEYEKNFAAFEEEFKKERGEDTLIEKPSELPEEIRLMLDIYAKKAYNLGYENGKKDRDNKPAETFRQEEEKIRRGDEVRIVNSGETFTVTCAEYITFPEGGSHVSGGVFEDGKMTKIYTCIPTGMVEKTGKHSKLTPYLNDRTLKNLKKTGKPLDDINRCIWCSHFNEDGNNSCENCRDGSMFDKT